MGVHTKPTTMWRCVTPICELCGVSLCYDIDNYEYNKYKDFWDGWCCEDCNPSYVKTWQKKELERRRK